MMNFPALFSNAACINLVRRIDRRKRVADRFTSAGIASDFFPAIDAQHLSHPKGFHSTAHRAVSLSFRFLVREAERRGLPSVLVFEDDCVLHPRFRERVAELEIPADWQLFYFGCLHVETPTRVGRGVVRVSRAYDMHAVAFRASAYRLARERMRGGGFDCGPEGLFNDVLLSELHQALPTYAAFPNLAWQEDGESDIARRVYSNYSETGAQLFRSEVVEPLFAGD